MESHEIRNLLNALRYLVHMCMDSVEAVSGGERLSLDGHKEIRSLRAHILQINKMIYNFDYLSSKSCERSELHFESFSWSEFADSLSDLFKYTITVYSPPALSFTDSFNTDESFLSDRTRLDILLLNALYFLSAQYNSQNSKKAKITLHLGQNDKYFILHIRNNSTPLKDESERINSILHGQELIIPEISPGSRNTKIAVFSMHKAASELGCEIKFSALKSGNKFELFIPKNVEINKYVLSSQKRYLPSQFMWITLCSDLFGEE